MSVEPGVVDANVLAYAVNADAPHYAASRALLESARDPSITLYVTSQTLCEFYSVIINPRRVAAASSPIEALHIISALLAFPGIHVLPSPARAVAGWMELLKRHPELAWPGRTAIPSEKRLELEGALADLLLDLAKGSNAAGCAKGGPQ